MQKNKKIVLIVFIILMVFGVSVNPQKVRAQGAATGIDPVAQVKDWILDPLATMTGKVFLQQMTNSVVNWINSGFEGDPAFVTNPKAFLLDVANETTGVFISEVGAAGLCESFRPNILIALSEVNTYTDRAECTLLDVVDNIDDFYNDFSNGGWAGWISLTQNPQNNPYGAYLITETELSRRVAEATGNAQKETDQNDGFLSLKVCTEYETTSSADCPWRDANGKCIVQNEDNPCKRYETQTPGRIIVNQLSESLGAGQDSLVAADEISEVITALVNFAVRKVQNGIVSIAQTQRRHKQRTGKTFNTNNTDKFSKLKDPFENLNTEESINYLKKLLAEVQYKLYDSRIIRQDTRFKPNSEEYSRLYKTFGKDIENSDDFGILAYNDKKNVPPEYIKGDGLYDGYDLIAKSPKVGPNDEPELFYLNKIVERMKSMFEESIEVRIAKRTLEQSIEIEESLNNKKYDINIETKCRYLDERDSVKKIMDKVKGELANRKFDISEINDYYGAGGTYQNLDNSYTKLNNLIKLLEGENNDENDYAQIQIIGQQIQSFRYKIKDPVIFILKRLEEMTLYHRTNPEDSDNLHCWIKSGGASNKENYVHGENVKKISDELASPLDICPATLDMQGNPDKNYDNPRTIPFVAVENYECNKWENTGKWTCDASCYYDDSEVKSHNTDNTGETSSSNSNYSGYTPDQCRSSSNYRECMFQITEAKTGLPKEYSLARRCQVSTDLQNSDGTWSSTGWICGFSSSNDVAECLVNVYDDSNYFCNSQMSTTNGCLDRLKNRADNPSNDPVCNAQ